MKNRAILVLVSSLVIAGLLLGACAAPAPTKPSTPTAPAPTAAPKTLKIGMNMTFNWPLGLDAQKMTDIDIAKVNKAGGLDLGGQKYLLETIWDDNKMDIALAKTIAQKEVFQDGVKFMCTDPYTPTIFQIVEENKIVCLPTMYDPDVFNPKWNWIWNTGAALALYPAVSAWVAEHNPKLKTYVVSCPDRMDGKIAGEIHTLYARAAGLKAFDPIYYPPSATDLSAIGTQIKQLNPDILDVHGGGPPMDATVLKAAYGAGWRGQVVASSTAPGSAMMGIAGPDAAEGMLGIGWPFEFEPASTPLGKEYKADYIAKFGKYEDTEPVLAYTYFCLKEALKKAGSIENTKVKAVLDAGFTFESPLGTSQRVNRPLSNNLRMVDHTAGNLPMKQIKNGKVVQIDFLTLDQSVKYYYMVYGKK